MAERALLIYAAWAVLGLGMRVLVQLLRTGDSGLRVTAARPGTPQWWTGLLFLAAMIAGPAAALAARAGLDPVAALDHPVPRAAGTAAAVLGVAGSVAVQLAMGRSWRIGVDDAERTALVTGGPFRIVRNPIYTAVAGAVLGLALMVPNVIALAGAAAVVCSLELLVRRVEEPYLRRAHGPAYERYAGRVGRFLPGVGRLRTPAGGAPVR